MDWSADSGSGIRTTSRQPKLQFLSNQWTKFASKIVLSSHWQWQNKWIGLLKGHVAPADVPCKFGTLDKATASSFNYHVSMTEPSNIAARPVAKISAAHGKDFANKVQSSRHGSVCPGSWIQPQWFLHLIRLCCKIPFDFDLREDCSRIAEPAQEFWNCTLKHKAQNEALELYQTVLALYTIPTPYMPSSIFGPL